MDMTNRQISINRLSVNNIERQTILQVSVTEEVAEGIQRQIGVYDFKINKTFSGIADPQLIPAINEVLASIPE